MRLSLAAARLAVLLTGLFLPGTVFAFEPSLTDADVSSAISQGQQQEADPGHGLQIAEYVLYDRPNPLHLTADDDLVDAVIVATPAERLLYASYLASVQGKPLSQTDGKQLAQNYANVIAFRIFAHSISGADQERDFLSRFSDAQLRLPSGKILNAAPSDAFGPSQDFFIFSGGQHVFRWLGAENFAFDLSGLTGDTSTLSATLELSDSSGHPYSYQVDLSRYR